MESLLPLLRCYCGGDLTVGGEGARCVACDREFPLREGVLVMNPDREDGEAERRQRQEEATRDRQVSFYEVWMECHIPSRIERGRLRAELGRLQPKTVLEVGCGPGRWSRLLAPRAERMIALDRSFRSLVRNRERMQALGVADRVLHVKGDATRLPAPDGTFDAVLSGQLLEHLPTPELRESVVREIARATRPGGRGIISTYELPGWNLFAGKKEGEHAGGMYYYRSSASEFRELMARHFGQVAVSSCLGHILLGVGAAD